MIASTILSDVYFYYTKWGLCILLRYTHIVGTFHQINQNKSYPMESLRTDGKTGESFLNKIIWHFSMCVLGQLFLYTVEGEFASLVSGSVYLDMFTHYMYFNYDYYKEQVISGQNYYKYNGTS